MKSLWNDAKASKLKTDPKQLRVYSSRLLGQNPDLVLHGGGNTSAKLTEKDIFGNDVEVLFIKGSGQNLATIEATGFASLQLDNLLKLAALDKLADTDLVAQQKRGMLDPSAPDVSVEALLHAVIPKNFVDHTHADSIIAITNTKNGQQRIESLFGERVLVVPYVKPGYPLAHQLHKMTQDTNWDKLEAIVLLSHGLVTFGDTAKESYEATINLVTEAENYLNASDANDFAMPNSTPETELTELAELRKAISEVRGVPVLASWNSNPSVVGFSQIENINSLAASGPATPDHSIYTKPTPMVLRGAAEENVKKYANAYKKYYSSNKTKQTECLEPSPRWVIWPGHGLVSVGEDYSETQIVGDIAEHTAKVIQQAEGLGGWQALPPKDVFEVEYWDLEQAKLANKPARRMLEGKVALVTGAASGIGLAVAKQLHFHGAAVVATDINPKITSMFEDEDFVGMVCDVCDLRAIESSVHQCVKQFGGLDIVCSNAGIFSQGNYIAKLDDKDWQRSLDLNLSQHKNLMQLSHPFLTHGIDPTFIVIGSKNVAAPGPGASAYSVAKAGLNQLTRVAALEWGAEKIRVNIVHPDCVFDTEIWAGGVLEQRAKKYEMTVEEYMTRNVLKTPVKSIEVANLVATLASPTFAKTTGAQFPIDGGNDRVI